MGFVLAIDQGTTSSRCILFDESGAVRAVAQKEFEQIYPRAGWVEHNPEEIWTSEAGVIAEALAKAKCSANDVKGIGITNQRETTIVWNRETGEPIHNAIVWQDRRTAAHCDRLVAEGWSEKIAKKTGLPIDAYFSATKIAWILDKVDGARKLANAGKLAFGTVDSWLVWRLTGGKTHVTDVTNAARTMLFDIHRGQWDDELLALFDIPKSMLPQVRSSSEVYAEVAGHPGLVGAPISGIAGDQHAALFGQLCFEPGQAKTTYGTGCFLLMNTGNKPIDSKNRLVTTVGWQRGGVTSYALEGSVFIGGAVVQWLRDGLGIIKSSGDVSRLAASVPDSGDVFLVPAFAGLGAPHWDSYARGTIVGLTRGTTAAHIARAAEESIAYQVADLLEAMQRDAGTSLPELRVDGGATQDDLLMQFQADILGVPVLRAASAEITALGAAYLAGLAVGFYKDEKSLVAAAKGGQRFEPKMPRDRAAALRARWAKALARSKDWAERETSS
jgi:glycerol kinase